MIHDMINIGLVGFVLFEAYVYIQNKELKKKMINL